MSDSVPGPGSYAHDKKMSNTGCNWSIGKAKKGKLLHSSATLDLGPGSYDPQLSSITKSCTIKGKYSSTFKLTDNEVPAPGT